MKCNRQAQSGVMIPVKPSYRKRLTFIRKPFILSRYPRWPICHFSLIMIN